MTTSYRAALWRCTVLASTMALYACGGGGGGDNPNPPPAPEPTTPTPPPPSEPAPDTQQLVAEFVAAIEKITAEKMPSSGEERYAMVDACYLNQGNTRKALIEAWDASSEPAESSAYLVGRKLLNVKILAERQITNADGSTRQEVDIEYDEKYTNGVTAAGLTDSLVAGSSSGSCSTFQTGSQLRLLGNRRVLAVSLVSRNRVDVFRQMADGKPTASPMRLRREVLFHITDAASAATYVVVSWGGGDSGTAARSLKYLSPRIARDAAEMQNIRGNANWQDTDRFRHCISNDRDNESNAATADCTGRGMSTDTWGWNTTNLDLKALAEADAGFATLGLNQPGAPVTFAVYADDGWKTVNGQAGKTPIGTYVLNMKNVSFPFAQLSLENYPMFNSIDPDEAKLAAAFQADGGTLKAQLQIASPPAGGLPLMLTSLYSFRQGPKQGSSGVTNVRTVSIPGTTSADGATATIPFGGKPEGAANTRYGEFGLGYGDRNGRELYYTLVFQ